MAFRILYLIFFMIFFPSCYRRIGDLNLISNRNHNESSTYVELSRGVVAKSRITSHRNALEEAIDRATDLVPGGEFMKNVQVEVRLNGKRVRVEGDVWGIQRIKEDKISELKIGDKVIYRKKTGSPQKIATVLGVDNKGVSIELSMPFGGKKYDVVHFDKVTKIGVDR
jgi:hypothetical protein